MVRTPKTAVKSVARPTDDRESGAAVVAAMLVLVLMAGLTAGLTALIITDTKVRSLDGTRTQSFYVAHAGLERLTADLRAWGYTPVAVERFDAVLDLERARSAR